MVRQHLTFMVRQHLTLGHIFLATPYFYGPATPYFYGPATPYFYGPATPTGFRAPATRTGFWSGNTNWFCDFRQHLTFGVLLGSGIRQNLGQISLRNFGVFAPLVNQASS